MKQIYIVNDKKSFITSLPPLTNIKVMTLKELEDKIIGTYNNEARTYMFLEKKIPLNLIDVYLDAFKYLNGKDINEKIKQLNSLKQELIDHKLYYRDEIFINSLNNVEITFYDLMENRHLTKIINLLKDKCKVNVKYREVSECNFKVHQYNSLEDELDDVIFKVTDLLSKNIPINKIKLMNVNSEYYPSLTRILNQYKLPFVNLYDSHYDTSNYVINFIKNLNTLGVKESIKLLDNNNYDTNILNIINDYAYLDDIELAKDFIIKDLKNLKISKEIKSDYLELVDSSYNINDDEYVFFLNFNNGSAPVIYDDSDLLTDEEYDLLGELTSSLKTNLKEKELITVLNKCYFISYKLVSLSAKHIPSYLLFKYEIKPIEEHNSNHLLKDRKYFSLDAEKFNYTLARDSYFKTKQKTKKYECLTYNFKNTIEKKSYNFTGINKQSLKDALDGKFNLSYSTLNTYYKCKFQYYLNSILNLNKYENTLATIRGNVYHKLLEECDKEGFDYDEVFNEEINKFEETDNRIRFFSSLIYDEFKILKDFNNELMEATTLKNIIREHKIEFHKFYEDYDITIKGFVDKIMFDDNNIALIDYKTGSSAKFKLDNLYYGLDLQLPMYAYFVSKDEKLKNKNIAGLYLQYVYKNFNDTELKNIKECNKAYRLDGYTNEALIDLMVNDSKKFLMHQKNCYPTLMINNIATFTEQKVEEAIKGIIDADFSINPHTIDDKNNSCEFCKFKDVCHFNGNSKDFKTIKPNYFLCEVKNRDILLACIDILKEEENEEVIEILNGDDDKINENLLNFINSKKQDDKILTLLSLLKTKNGGDL